MGELAAGIAEVAYQAVTIYSQPGPPQPFREIPFGGGQVSPGSVDPCNHSWLLLKGWLSQGHEQRPSEAYLPSQDEVERRLRQGDLPGIAGGEGWARMKQEPQLLELCSSSLSCAREASRAAARYHRGIPAVSCLRASSA